MEVTSSMHAYSDLSTFLTVGHTSTTTRELATEHTSRLGDRGTNEAAPAARDSLHTCFTAY